MPKLFNRGTFSFWREPQEEREARERKQQEYETKQREDEVKELLQEARKNKDAFEGVIDKVCLMIGEKLMSGKITDQNFTLKIQSIIEGLRKLAWPQNQPNSVSKSNTTDPKEWVNTLTGLRNVSWRVDQSNPQNTLES